MTQEIARRVRVPSPKQDPAVSVNPDALLTAATVADLCGCRPNTVRDWVRQGRFPKPLRMGRNTRWRAQVVTEWLQARLATEAGQDAMPPLIKPQA